MLCMALSSNEFVAKLKTANVNGGRIVAKTRLVGQSDVVFVNFYNVPPGEWSGADRENNRVMFRIGGFDRNDETIPASKLRISLEVSFFPRARGFRARHMGAEKAAEFLIEFMETIAREYEPSLAGHSVL